MSDNRGRGVNFHKEVQNILYNEAGLTKKSIQQAFNDCMRDAINKRVNSFDIEKTIQDVIQRAVDKVLDDMTDPDSRHWSSARERFTTLIVQEAGQQIRSRFQLDISIKGKRGDINNELSIPKSVPEQ